MTGFTKGSWKVTDTGDISIDIDAPYYEALGVGVNDQSPFCVVISRRHIASRLESNANLIAAAPDLYEALSDCIDIIETEAAQFYHSPAVDAAKQALAKARGEV